MDFFAQLNWIDLFILALLAGFVFLGWTQGLVRYALSTLGALIAFILAAQLKRPITDALGFWTAFNQPLRELWLFVVLYIGGTVGIWFAVRALYRTTRLPVPRQLDELGGGVLGFVFAVIVIVFLLVGLDTFFRTQPDVIVADAGILRWLYDVLNSSLLVQVFRETVIPTVGVVVRPFVPNEVAEFLQLP